MRIGFVTSDADIINGEFVLSGTGWYRAHLPAQRLAQHGHETVVTNSIVQHPGGSLHPVDVHGDHYDCDVLVLQRWMKYQAPEGIAEAVASGQVVINDVDDWFFGIPTSNQAFTVTHPRFDKTTETLTTRRQARAQGTGITTENRTHFYKGLASSSAITVSTSALLERMTERFPRVPVLLLRNPIDLERFTELEDVTDGPTVGWTGGIPWRGHDLQLLKGVLGPYLERHDLRFIHGGHHFAAPVEQTAAHQLGIPEARVERRGIVPITSYRELLNGFDIGVIPIDLTPFNACKSALKGLEFGAAGIPFVASATPEYQWLGSGLLARKPKQWIAHLERLLEPEERVTLGKACRARSEAESIDERWPEWERVYADLAG